LPLLKFQPSYIGHVPDLLHICLKNNISGGSLFIFVVVTVVVKDMKIFSDVLACW